MTNQPRALTRRDAVRSAAALGAVTLTGALGGWTLTSGTGASAAPAAVDQQLRDLRRMLAGSHLDPALRRRFMVKIARTQQALKDGEPQTAVTQLVVLRQLVRVYRKQGGVPAPVAERMISAISEIKRALMATIPVGPTRSTGPSGSPSPTGSPTVAPTTGAPTTGAPTDMPPPSTGEPTSYPTFPTGSPV